MPTPSTPDPREPRHPHSVGSTSLAPGSRAPRRRGLLFLLLLLIAAAAIFLISRCAATTDTAQSDPGPAPTSGSTTTDSTQAGSTQPTTGTTNTAAVLPPGNGANGAPGQAPPGSEAGAVLSNSTPLLTTAENASTTTTLASFTGQPAVGQAVPVQSVPADEGFWVGTSTTDRLWIHLTGEGESPYTVQPGDRVTFTGTVTTNPADFATDVGVDPSEGAEQLTTQGAHIQVPKTSLTLAP